LVKKLNISLKRLLAIKGKVADMKNYFDVVILGAGAAGLMCAITAAKRSKLF
jgi:ribulose 1,5-bisphosphate synthetase/thiazole synthase